MSSLGVMMADGRITSDVIFKNQVVQRIVWRSADLLSAGVNTLPTINYDVIDIANAFPGNMLGQYPLAPGTRVQLERSAYTPYGYTLYKFEARWAITGEAKIRGNAAREQRTASRKAAEALAFWKDKEILDRVIAGAYATNNVTVGAGDEWNSGGPTADPEGDIVDAWNNLISNGYSGNTAFAKVSLVVPAKVYGNLLKLMLIGNVQQRLKDYLKGSYAIDIYPTRYTNAITHPPGSIYTLAGSPAGIADAAYMVVYSEDVGELGIYTGDAIPMAGHKIDETGEEDWFVRQYFASKVMPNSSSDATNVGIAKILNVC